MFKGHINTVVGQFFGDGPYLSDENHCDYAIWAPSHRSQIENCAFTCYAMRQEEIEQVIDLMVAAGPDRCNDFDIQCSIYKQVGIDSDTFTDEEIEYIEREVARKLV